MPGISMKDISTTQGGAFQPVAMYRVDKSSTGPTREEGHTGCIALDGTTTIEELFQFLMREYGWGPAHGVTLRFATRVSDPPTSFDSSVAHLVEQGDGINVATKGADE